MEDYRLLLSTAEGFLEEEPFYASALSNISALIMEAFPNLNWAGFYLAREGRLTVGPFQGKPACIHIEFGKGVCGTAAAEDRTVVVPDVHQFPGHIACDSASNSEIVIPIHAGGKIAGVLDIDSPLFDRFSEDDRKALEALVREIETKTAW
ncbi:MAG: GAF domain-containing protein [Eubacterium sp.]|nr:GAF domain-containing protein [Eubacterium sp.]